MLWAKINRNRRRIVPGSDMGTRTSDRSSSGIRGGSSDIEPPAAAIDQEAAAEASAAARIAEEAVIASHVAAEDFGTLRLSNIEEKNIFEP